MDPDAIVDKTGRSSKEVAYDNLHRQMTAAQLAVNNILDRDLSKIDTSNRPPGVRQVGVCGRHEFRLYDYKLLVVDGNPRT